jgi:DNA-binding CsgD family transcriptional regulator
VPASAPVLALCADVVGSRRQPERTAAFLAGLPAVLASVAGAGLVRPFAAVRGDEVEGVLAAGADPFRPIVAAALQPDAPALRWAVVAGDRSTAPVRAAAELPGLKARGEMLVVRTGHPSTDMLLADLAPLLHALVGDMTPHQRDIVRRILVEGRRQATVAAELGVSRATVSVAVSRGRLRDLERAMHGLHGLSLAGIGTAAWTGPPEAPGAAAAQPAEGSPRTSE